MKILESAKNKALLYLINKRLEHISARNDLLNEAVEIREKAPRGKDEGLVYMLRTEAGEEEHKAKIYRDIIRRFWANEGAEVADEACRMKTGK